MRAQLFDYRLPDSLIAKEPASPRDACRLMVLNPQKNTIGHRRFFDIKDYLRPGDVLVFNKSKVIPARIVFEIEGRMLELFLLRKIDDKSWLVLGKPGKLLKPGKSFTMSHQLAFTVKEILEDGQRLVEFSQSGVVLDRMLEELGSVPLPPYLKDSKASFSDYQTVYASEKGSVAAPTAGLHFTNRLLQSLRSRGVQLEFVTLHVGLGTFLPIKGGNLDHHRMHSEWFFVDVQTAKRLQKAKKEGRRIIAVGTTSVRVLESSFVTGKGFLPGFGETALFIQPGYQWKAVDALITNFHLPKSTLLVLTCAFGGRAFVLKAYREAVRRRYRFFSFGDAMLIL